MTGGAYLAEGKYGSAFFFLLAVFCCLHSHLSFISFHVCNVVGLAYCTGKTLKLRVSTEVASSRISVILLGQHIRLVLI